MDESFVLAHLHEDFFLLANAFPSQFPGCIRLLHASLENRPEAADVQQNPLLCAEERKKEDHKKGPPEPALPPVLYFQVVHIVNVAQSREEQSRTLLGGGSGSGSGCGSGCADGDQDGQLQPNSVVDATLQECEAANAALQDGATTGGGGRSLRGGATKQQRCLKLLLTDGRDLIWAVERSLPLFPCSSPPLLAMGTPLFPAGIAIGSKIRVDRCLAERAPTTSPSTNTTTTTAGHLLHRGVVRLEGRYTTLLGGGVKGLQSYWEAEAREYIQRRSGRPAAAAAAAVTPADSPQAQAQPQSRAAVPVPVHAVVPTSEPLSPTLTDRSTGHMALPAPDVRHQQEHQAPPPPQPPLLAQHPSEPPVIALSTPHRPIEMALSSWMLEVLETLTTNTPSVIRSAGPPVCCRVRAIISDVLSDLHFMTGKDESHHDERGGGGSSGASSGSLSYALMVRLADVNVPEAAVIAARQASYHSSSSYADSALSMMDESGFCADPAVQGWNFLSGSLPVYLGNAMLESFIGFPACVFAGVSQLLDDIAAFLAVRGGDVNGSCGVSVEEETTRAEQLMEAQALLFSRYPETLGALHVALPPPPPQQQQELGGSPGSLLLPSLPVLHGHYRRQAEVLQQWIENAVGGLGRHLEELGERSFTIRYTFAPGGGNTRDDQDNEEEQQEQQENVWSSLRQHSSSGRNAAKCFRQRSLLLQRRSRRHNKVVFLDVAITPVRSTVSPPSIPIQKKPHRLVIELFSKDFPVAAQNFEDFCTGRMMKNDADGGDGRGAAKAANKADGHNNNNNNNNNNTDVLVMESGDDSLFPSSSPLLRPHLSYRQSTFHRFHKGFLIQGGDVHSGAGVGQMSMYGDETFDAPEEREKSLFTSLSAYAHNGQYSPKGLVGTAVAAPHLNGSQFFILTTHRLQDVEHLNHTCICFGQVQESSLPVLDALERQVPVQAGGEVADGVRVEIVDCGLA